MARMIDENERIRLGLPWPGTHDYHITNRTEFVDDPTSDVLTLRTRVFRRHEVILETGEHTWRWWEYGPDEEYNP